MKTSAFRHILFNTDEKVIFELSFASVIFVTRVLLGLPTATSDAHHTFISLCRLGLQEAKSCRPHWRACFLWTWAGILHSMFTTCIRCCCICLFVPHLRISDYKVIFSHPQLLFLQAGSWGDQFELLLEPGCHPIPSMESLFHFQLAKSSFHLCWLHSYFQSLRPTWFRHFRDICDVCLYHAVECVQLDDINTFTLEIGLTYCIKLNFLNM